MVEPRRFPQYLSSPFQILWFEADELGILVICFALALLFGDLFWLSLFAGPYLYSVLKRRYPRGYFKHLIYFMGLVKIEGYPSYFEESYEE